MWSVTKFPHWNVRVSRVRTTCPVHASGGHTKRWPQGASEKGAAAQRRPCRGRAPRGSGRGHAWRPHHWGRRSTHLLSACSRPRRWADRTADAQKMLIKYTGADAGWTPRFFSFRKIYCSLGFQITKWCSNYENNDVLFFFDERN